MLSISAVTVKFLSTALKINSFPSVVNAKVQQRLRVVKIKWTKK